MDEDNCSNKTVSLIIPVYNTGERLLRKCINSAIHQTYEKMEIICIDDGSTDGSGAILDEYSTDYPQMKVIHTENGGESRARNVGLLQSTGEYIGFMDCDDWIDADMYQLLVEQIEKNHADMAAVGWYKSFDDCEIEMTNKKSIQEGIINRELLLRYLYERDAYQGFAYMWDKLYRRDKLMKSGKILLFDENLKLGGDVLYLAQAALQCESVVFLSKSKYHYYQRKTSGCHTDNLGKRKDWLDAYLQVVRLFEDNNVETETISYVKRFLAYHSSNTAEMAYNQKNYGVLRYTQKLMREYKNEYVTLNQEYPERILRYQDVLNY